MRLKTFVNQIAKKHKISKDEAGIRVREMIRTGVVLIDADWNVIK